MCDNWEVRKGSKVARFFWDYYNDISLIYTSRNKLMYTIICTVHVGVIIFAIVQDETSTVIYMIDVDW